MPFLLLKFAHIGSMFLATALAVGPSVLLYLIARTGDETAIRRALALTTSVFRVGGALYGLGLLFGFAAALTGELGPDQVMAGHGVRAGRRADRLQSRLRALDAAD
jgi:hypothetical protein